MLNAITRLTLQEAALLSGRSLALLEEAAERRELAFVLSGSVRRLRTTPNWVFVWNKSRRGPHPPWGQL